MIARKHLVVPAVTLGSLLAGALYTWFTGEDINWDRRNYHEYGAFALLNGRFDVDVAPGGFQTFLNPSAYLPAYVLFSATIKMRTVFLDVPGSVEFLKRSALHTVSR
jgi:hypothetical protein